MKLRFQRLDLREQRISAWALKNTSELYRQHADATTQRSAEKETRHRHEKKWARQDSNLGPRDYESPALTAELQAQLDSSKSSAFRTVTNLESVWGCSNSESQARRQC